MSDAALVAMPSSLLAAVAEQLKLPLTQIARQAELAELTGDVTETNVTIIRRQVAMALTLVDSYLLGLQMMGQQTTLALEPVAVSSLLVDVAHELDQYAKQYHTDLEVCVAGKYQPAMAHPAALRAALISAGHVLIAGSEQGAEARKRVTLAVHRTPHGIATGVYGMYESLTAQAWRNALVLCGTIRQPLQAFSTGGSAGIFVAEALFESMSSRLRVGRFQKQIGLSARLQPSTQLQLV